MKDLILIFDTETSGIYRKWKSVEDQPHILQFSYILFDVARRRIVKMFDHYVQVAPSVVISDEITQINGCTRELCDAGRPITSLLAEFYYDFHLCERVIAHNLEFDAQMILTEFQRHWSDLEDICPNGLQLFSPDYLETEHIQLLCTMKATTQLVKAPYKNPKPDDVARKNFKWPTLAELHQYCFGCVPENLHNSLVDVLVTLRCLLFYQYQYTISDATMKTWTDYCLIQTAVQ